MKKCADCNCEIHPLANHTGCEKWCEECFEKGLHRDMNEHWDNFWKQELNPQSAEKMGNDPASDTFIRYVARN